MEVRGPALIQAIQQARQAPDSISTDELRQRVCDVAEAGRALGWPPERVVIAVKRLATEAGLSPSRQVISSLGPLTPSDQLLTQLIRWAIDCYFEERKKAG